jgi:hypothetical protein
MPNPATPWKVETRNPLKIFLDDSPDALREPALMTVRMINERAAHILLDGDVIRFPEVACDQLRAICDHLPAADPKRVDLRVLQKHPAFRVPDRVEPELDQVESAIRDNLKKHRFRDAITFDSGSVIFRCKVEFV